MNKKTKRNAVVSAMLAVMLCISLITGATFALFTSESNVNIAVTSGKVNVVATLEDLELYSPTAIALDGTITDAENDAENGTFANGGTATIDDNTLTIENMIPGDKVTFKITMTNKSTVDVKYRMKVVLLENEGLYDALTFDFGGQKVKTFSDWAVFDVESKTIDCSVEFPNDEDNNDYQDASCKVAFVVEAVQGNTEPSIAVSDIAALREAIATAGANGYKIVLNNDIELTYNDCEELTKYQQTAMFVITKDTVVDLNGKTLKYENDESVTIANEYPQCWHGFYVDNGATLTIIDSSEDKSGAIYSNDPIGTYLVCAVGNATVNIYGGNFHSEDGAAIYKNNGYVNIYGGRFETVGHQNQLLNLGNGYRNSYPPFMVYGGSFKNFEPGVTNSPETKVANGCKVVKDGDWYNVVVNTDINVTEATEIDYAGMTIALNDGENTCSYASANGEKITVSNATFTGETLWVGFGEYKGKDSSNFNTEVNNVTIKDLKVNNNIGDKSKTISCGAYVYGTAVLNDCVMNGTTSTESVDDVYDIAFVNNSNGTINGGEYGSIYAYTHASLTIKNAKIEKLTTGISSANAAKKLCLKNTSVKTLVFNCSDSYMPTFDFDENTTVEEVIWRGVTYTWADFLTAYNAAMNA